MKIILSNDWGRVCMRYKIIVWGLGRVTRTLLRSGYLDEAEIVGFIDSNTSTFAHSGGEADLDPGAGLDASA